MEVGKVACGPLFPPPQKHLRAAVGSEELEKVVLGGIMRILFDLLIAEQQCGNALVSIREMLTTVASSSQEHEYILVTGRPKDYRRQADMPNVRVYPLKLESKNGVLMQHQLR